MTVGNILTICAVLVSALVGIGTIRNSRRAASAQVQNTDLTRIRDLRAEIKDLRDEVRAAREETSSARSEASQARQETAQHRMQMAEMNDWGNRLLQERMEMIRFAQMPGVDIHQWLDRYGNEEHPRPIGGAV
jgi:outer membrane murein-binding lipoprotein Lpp